MKKTSSIVMLGALLCCGQTAFAGDAPVNECTKLSILLVNTTQNTCKLLHQNLIHGFIVNMSHVPGFIPAGTTAPELDLEQGYFGGPEIELTYQCGDNKKITLHSKQNFCFMAAGGVVGHVGDRQNMDAEYSAKEGSWFWGQHGTLSWALTDR
jgi:hypothetical protein